MRGHKINLDKLEECYFVQAVPGAGKTTSMIQEHTLNKSMCVVQTKEGKRDLLSRVEKDKGHIVEKQLYRTSTSLLVNGVNVNFPIVETFFDEAIQQHAGVAAFIMSITGCKKFKCYGDQRQIHFHPRVTNFVCAYKDLDEIIPINEFKSVTHRVPKNQISMIIPDYADVLGDLELTSSNETNAVVELKDYNDNLLRESVKDDTVILTFTQSDKKSVLNAIANISKPESFKGVYTATEFQGQAAKHVVVVRKNNTNKMTTIYNDPNQVVVLCSRNTVSLTYLTTCKEDLLSKKIYDWSRKIGGGRLSVKPVLPIKRVCLRDIKYPNVCVNLGDFNPKAHFNISMSTITNLRNDLSRIHNMLSEDAIVFISDHIYDKFDDNMINSLLPKVFDGRKVVLNSGKRYSSDVVVSMEEQLLIDHVEWFNRIEEDDLTVEIPQNPIVRDSVVIDLGMLQFIYDRLFPNSSYRDYWLDSWEVNNSIITPEFGNLNVKVSILDYVSKTRNSNFLSPTLITHMSEKRENSLQEQLLGLYKRNANAPPCETAINYHDQSDRLLEGLMSVFRKGDTDLRIAVTRAQTDDWLDDKGIAVIKAVQQELSMPLDFSKWNMMIKTDVKPVLTDDIIAQYPAVQTIVFNSKCYNALFAPFLIQLKKRLLYLLDPNKVFVMSDYAISVLEGKLNSAITSLRGDVLEMDMGKFDKSQGLTALMFELKLFERAMMPTWMRNLWFISHFWAKIYGFGTSLKTSLPHQRRSGDPWTYGGNTFFLLAILIELCGNSANFYMVSGDDSLVYGNFPEKRRKLICETVAIVLIVNAVSAFEFERAPIVTWTKSPVYVSTTSTLFTLRGHWTNPCSILHQFRINQDGETDRAVRQCLHVFHQHVTLKIATAASRRVASSMPSSMVPQNAIQQVPQKMTGVETNQVRQRRSITSFVTGVIASNLLETFVDKVWPSQPTMDLKTETLTMQRRLAELNHIANFTQIQLDAMNEQFKLTTALVEENVERIDAITYAYPELTVVSAHIIAKAHLFGSYVERIGMSFQARRPDLITVQQAFETDLLADVDPDSIVDSSVSIRNPYPNVLELSFEGRRRERDVAVYKVNTFRFWGDLLSKETKYEYVGPKYVVYDRTHKCAKGVKEPGPRVAFVTVQCYEKGFTDHRLALWRPMTGADTASGQPEVHEIWPYVYVYCYSDVIHIHGITEDCPPYAFKLNASERWSTTSGYEYSPSAIEIEAVSPSDEVLMDVSHVHFRNTSSYRFNEVEAIRKLHIGQTKLEKLVNATQALTREKQIAIEANLLTTLPNGVGVSYKTTTYILMGFFAGSLTAAIYSFYQKIRLATELAERVKRNTRSSGRSEHEYLARRVLYGRFPRVEKPSIRPGNLAESLQLVPYSG